MELSKLEAATLSYKEIAEYVSMLKSNVELIAALEQLKKDERKNVKTLVKRIEKSIEKYKSEVIRTKSMYDLDKSFGEYRYVAGVDEVGRGPLAGPIVAAAVILNLNYKDDKDLIIGLNDSKKLSSKTREELSKVIMNRAVDFKISFLSNSDIDKKGIAWCNNEVFKIACSGLKYKPDLVLSDGYAIKNFNIKNEFLIKGDSKSASIAAASIIAKVYRDNLMKEYSAQYTMYSFDKNVGYGTKEHVDAIKKYGITKIHRNSFLKNIL